MNIDLSKLDPAQKRRIEKIIKLGTEGMPAILEYLIEIEDRLDNEIPSIKDVISRVKGDKGDVPIKGKDYADGYTPKKGIDYDDGKPGKDFVPTDSDLARIAAKVKIPVQDRIIEKRTETIIKELPVIKETIKETITNNLSPQEIRDSLESLQEDDRLDAKAIKGIEEYLKELNPGNGPMLHTPSIGNLPDVSTVGIQTNQILVWNGISFVPGDQTGGGSGSTAVETPTPSVGDGTNLVFAFTHTPLFVIVGSPGLTYFQNFGYTLSGTTVTFDAGNQPAVGQVVRSLYTTSVAPSGNNAIAATGTINDSNVSFGFATQPTLMIINGLAYLPTGGAITWSYSGGTATLSSPVGTGGSIFGVSGTYSSVTVTGTINNSNTSFTAGSQPTYLVMNGGAYLTSGSDVTWSYLAGAITTSIPVGTGGSLFGLSGITFTFTSDVITGVS